MNGQATHSVNLNTKYYLLCFLRDDIGGVTTLCSLGVYSGKLLVINEFLVC